MKYLTLSCLLFFAACANNSSRQSNLIAEQKLLKDSTNIINDKLGEYLQQNLPDSAEAQRKQLGLVYGRLTSIQLALDSLTTAK
ncbi:MAG: hypothetical protein J7621_29100 [Niastella sp.]|nr:hypothetical protein [Niastella sp.]